MFYADVYLVVDWEPARSTFLGFFGRPGREISTPESVDYFFRPGLTWPRRTQIGLGMRVMPAGCIFADKGPAAFVDGDEPDELLALLAVTTSAAFRQLVDLQMAFGSYEVGVIQRTPVPPLTTARQSLATLARRAWSLKRTLDTVEETSHAFLLPATLRPRTGDYDPPAIEAELADIQAEIDAVALDLYGLDEADIGSDDLESPAATGDAGTAEPAQTAHRPPTTDHLLTDHALLSWCVGVVFGRFDSRLAAGEREPPPKPEPFDPLPSKSPGMLPDDSRPFHPNRGILVDDPGHTDDLAHLIESVLERVDLPAPLGVRRWLQRDFFTRHLKQYSKSRRKAPIYWPLSTPSGSYTLWLYYHRLDDQILYACVNEFVAPKLEQVSDSFDTLRQTSARSTKQEKEFAALTDLKLELEEFRDQLLRIAATWRPNLNDGVQITAAPLWPLFRLKPWQKVLKDSWTKLEKGDYDWAHLALHYWPERVREKCRSDKSLAIAHDLEDLYEPPPEQPKKKRRKGKSA